MATEQNKKRPRRANQLIVLGLSLLIAFTLFVLSNRFNIPQLIEDFERKTFDLRMALKLGDIERQPSKDIVIVAFDDPTLYLYEPEYGTWPWPRSLHAEMIEYFERAGARMIAYDILFIANRRGSEGDDRRLVDAFAKYRNVYLGMNLDNYKYENQENDRQITASDMARIQPMALRLDNQMKPRQSRPLTGADGFYTDKYITYNNFRPVMAGFYETGHRLAVVNHSRDDDGVSRSNPLIFRLKTTVPVESRARPFRAVKTAQGQTIWQDQSGRRVDPKRGLLLTPAGALLERPTEVHMPHFTLKLVTELALEEQRLKQVSAKPAAGKAPPSAHTDPLFTLTEKGRLRFLDRDLPLTRDGQLIINWYNVNVDEQSYRHYLTQELEPYHQQLQARLQQNPGNTLLQKELVDVERMMEQVRQALKQHFEPKPYPIISAAEVLKAIRHAKAGQPTERDQQLLALFKDKIIFVGTTAVASFDIKTTPISRILPGVVLQATLFDNLYQNAGFIHRLDPTNNILISGVICLLSALAIIRMRSALMGLFAAFLVAAIYISITVLLFKHNLLWLDIAMPVVCLVLTTTFTYMVKYISRDRDYERTYKLATTDGLTGLYNHRYFQEYMQRAIQKAERGGSKFSLMLIDIDFFKKFNDTYGHQAGDEVLRHVARKLENSVRSDDLVARYGGEEMAIVLDRANEAEALEVARKVVRLVAEEAYPIAPNVNKNVTISVGVATYPSHGGSPTELIEFADQGLYRAKEAGRNQVGAQHDDASLPPPASESDTAPSSVQSSAP
ncbi:MAG: diguanylate cyclase [Candidatus Melainabacteria bacterium]|nr:diguanylate cyclase [Candidatus Melainabacteria bacterium]